jgi:AraC-like DNA-binding protein
VMKISTALLKAMFDFLKSYNLNQELIEKASGIKYHLLKNIKTFRTIDDYFSLIKTAAKLTHDPYFAFRLVEALDNSDLTLISIVNKNLAEALNYFFSFNSNINESAQCSLKVVGNKANIIVNIDAPNNYHQFIADFYTARLMSIIRHWTADQVIFDAVYFRHSRPANLRLYKRHFASKLHFKAENNSLVFKARYLSTELSLGQQDVSSVIANYVIHGIRLTQEYQETSWPLKTRNAVLHFLPSGDVSAVSICRYLHTSRNTLHRKLAESNSSFKTILDETRKRLALEYLKSRAHSIKEVAYLLGFTDPAPFHRSFRRWFGTTPRKYLKQLLNKS